MAAARVLRLLLAAMALALAPVPVSLQRSAAAGELSALCESLVAARGYHCEDRRTTTADGYVLALQRISSSSAELHGGELRPPVLLLHGLMMGAETWLLNSPAQALALVLADAPFDVWLGNTRGSRWSHGHITLPRSGKKYWDWTWDEIAKYDLPALLLHVSEASKQSRVLFVGHSQGTMVALAGAIQQPLVAHSVAAAVLLAPIAHLAHVRSSFAHAASEVFLDKVARSVGLQEFNVRNKLGQAVVAAVCVRSTVDCSHMLAAITGDNCCLNLSNVREFMPWLPSSTSVRNMAHYAQMIRSGQWRKYDYGPLLNLLHYGAVVPPLYNASLISRRFPVLVAYGGQDELSVPEDVEQLMAEMQVESEALYLPEYGHVDFVLSTSARQDVYRRVVAFLVKSSEVVGTA